MTTADFFDIRTRNWRARLAISVDLMRELSGYSDPRDLFQVFSRRMGQLFPTSRQLTLSRRGVEPPDVRVTRFNLWHDAADPFANFDQHPTHTGGLLADLLYADEPRLIDDLVIDPDDPAMDYLEGQQSLLAIPIFEGGVAQTTLVLTRDEPAAFAPEQVPELVWMTNLFGRAAQTLVLSEALQMTYEDADAEIRAIAELQESLLPGETPTIPGLDIAAHYSTAHRAGGDYYDFFPQPDGSIGVLIADVSGHGAPAAVLMAITHSIAHAGDAPTSNAGGFLTHLNYHIAGNYNRTSGSFVTAFYAIANPTARTLSYASAGHLPPLVFKADGSFSSLNRVQQLPLGVSTRQMVYPQHHVPYSVGDGLVLFTDGVTESLNRHNEFFGTDRLHTLLDRRIDSSSEVLVRVLAEIDRFSDGVPQIDDRTVVVVRATE